MSWSSRRGEAAREKAGALQPTRSDVCGVLLERPTPAKESVGQRGGSPRTQLSPRNRHMTVREPTPRCVTASHAGQGSGAEGTALGDGKYRPPPHVGVHSAGKKGRGGEGRGGEGRGEDRLGTRSQDRHTSAYKPHGDRATVSHTLKGPALGRGSWPRRTEGEG